MIISNALEMFTYLKDSFTTDPPEGCCHKRRVFIFADNVVRSRSDRRPNNPVPKTRQIHCVHATGESNTIAHRRLSCYCLTCLDGSRCEVMSQLPQGAWKAHTFKVMTTLSRVRGSATLAPSEISHTASADPSTSISTPAPTSYSPLTVDPATEPPEPSTSTNDPPIDPSTILATLQSFKDFATLKHAAIGLHNDLRPVTMRQLQANGLRVDAAAQDLYPSDGPYLTPISIYGDGNCLPRCGSLLAYGTEERHLEMRARIVLELAVHKSHYLNNLVAAFCAQYSDHFIGQELSELAVEEILNWK